MNAYASRALWLVVGAHLGPHRSLQFVEGVGDHERGGHLLVLVVRERNEARLAFERKSAKAVCNSPPARPWCEGPQQGLACDAEYRVEADEDGQT